jgi:hypothetical protein
MIIKLSESELRSIIEKVIREQSMGGMTSPQNFAQYSVDVLDSHTNNLILAILTSFIPVVGPFISAGIGLIDAKKYYDEGDKKTAGLMVMFSSLPGLGLLGKLGLTKWTAKTLGEIGKKIGLGQKLTPTEVEVAKKITQYRNLIETEMKKKAISLNAAKQNVKSQLKRKPYVNTAKSLGKYTGLSTGYDIGYDYLNPQQNIKNIMGINTSEIHDNNKQAALEIKF